MAQQMEVSSEAGFHGARLVWVLNRDVKPYMGTYRGVKVTIPANMEKIGKRFDKGGNLMGYLEAREFITDLKEPQGFREDGSGKREPIFGVKALLDAELTEEEFGKYVGKTKEQLKKEAASDERRASKNLSKALNKIPRKIAVGDDE